MYILEKQASYDAIYSIQESEDSVIAYGFYGLGICNTTRAYLHPQRKQVLSLWKGLVLFPRHCPLLIGTCFP